MAEIPLDVLVIAGVVIIAVIVGILAAINPVLFRMALRNLTRRRAQSAIVVGGLLIGTAIISSSLVVGDTLEFIFVEDVLDRLDRVDEIVGLETQTGYANFTFDNFTALESWLTSRGAPVDGVAPALLRVVPVQNIDGDKADQAIAVMGINDSYEEGFGDLVTLDGRQVGTASLGPMEVWVNEWAAEELNASAGHTMRLFYGVNVTLMTVEGVVRNEGKANWQKEPVILMKLEDAQAAFNEPGLINLIRISNSGDVEGGVVHSDAVTEEVQAFLDTRVFPEDAVLKVDPVKKDGLKEAEEFSEEITQVFLIMGTFSIIAGLLLIINIFVMLSEERKPEMGVSRAIGMKRRHLTEAFLFEGAMYVAIAAALGTFLGLGLGYLIIYAFGLIFPMGDLNPTFHFENDSLLTAFSLGVIISLGAVLLASWRVSKLNIVRAIRDIPEPQERKVSRFVALMSYALVLWGSVWTLRGFESESIWTGAEDVFLAVVLFAGLVCVALAGAAGMAHLIAKALRKRPLAERSLVALVLLIAAGAAFFALAFLFMPLAEGEDFPLYRVSGPPLIFLGAAIPLAYRINPRIPFTVAGAFTLLYVLIPMEYGETSNQIYFLFIATGVLLVLGAVLVTVFNMTAILRALRFLLGRNRPRPVLQTAISYPMGKRFRTGMTLGMFALIIFTVTVISMIQEMQSSSLSDIVETQSGGFDLLAYSASFTPIASMEQRLEENLPGQVEAVSNATVAPVIATNLATGKQTGYTIWGVSDLLILRNEYASRVIRACSTPDSST